jgi:hypothetical protein
MKRIIRFIGNRTVPENEVYGTPAEARAAVALQAETKRMLARLDKVAKPKRPPRPPKLKPIDEPFETNLMEPLVGWKTWLIRNGLLHSQLRSGVWPPGKPFQAMCKERKCVHPPTTTHTCGIYARDKFLGVREFLDAGEACGIVLGWGRYVRGVDGWRSEFAYPARILIARDSLGDLEKLKEYRVPLYVMEPMRLYDPAEDGYEYWDNEADWGFGANTKPNAQEVAGRDEKN